MKTSVLLVVLLLFSGFSNAQEAGKLKKYFGQAQFITEDVELMTATENLIREQAGIWMVRIDPSNGSVLVYTTELPYCTKEEFLALFGKASDKVRCAQIGVVRQDPLRKFPFKDCE
jgi:hypothetical protein